MDSQGRPALRLGLYLDQDQLEWARAEAEKLGIGYQTFIRRILRQAMYQHMAMDERHTMKSA
mgnify:CR=1 FL=1